MCKYREALLRLSSEPFAIRLWAMPQSVPYPIATSMNSHNNHSTINYEKNTRKLARDFARADSYLI